MFDPRVDSIISELKRLNQHFCKKVKCCLGISPQGDSNLVLNQQGDWVPTGSGGDIQTLLLDLPEYLGAKEASEDGKLLDYWYYNTFFNTVSKVTQYIDTFSSGTSTIDFINNGGDDWDISFLATPTTVQSSANITGYQYGVTFWNSGVHTPLSGGFKTTDFTFNTAGNGAGVYEIYQTFVFDDNSIFRVTSLYKVNSIGVVVAFVSANGVSVNNTNGLIINATAHYTEYGVSYPLIWASYDNYPPSSLNVLGNTTTINANVPIDSIGIGYYTALDSVFTDDYAGSTGSVASIVIS